MTDPSRTAFEHYFAHSRKSKGVSKRPTFERLGDDTYVDDHTQRHWWTWQQAGAACAAAEREQLDCVRQALPEAWRNSVPSVAVATLTAELDLARRVNVRLAGAIDMIRETLDGSNVQDLRQIINAALAEYKAAHGIGETK